MAIPKSLKNTRLYKKMNYFKNFTDERLKEIIPDRDTNYSKAEREELIKNGWTRIIVLITNKRI